MGAKLGAKAGLHEAGGEPHAHICLTCVAMRTPKARGRYD